MSDGKKWTRRAAIGFIGAGAGLFALNTGAATQIYSDRNVSFGTAEDDNALLPLSDKSGNASISGSSDEAVVYEIGQNQNNLGWEFTNAEILSVGTSTGSVENPGITVSGEGETVEIGCNSSGEFEGEYEITLRLTAEVSGENGPLSVTTERKTQRVSIDCRSFYSRPENYSDSDKGKATQPKEGPGAIGRITNPGGITGEGAASLKGTGGNPGLRVEFRLPDIGTAGCYELIVDRGQGSAKLDAFIVNSDYDKLTDKKNVNKKERSELTFKNEEAKNISNNMDDLFLIFKTTSSNTQEINFVDFDYCHV